MPQRNPVYTAKQVADLDVLSGGRVEFGIGIGWLREEFDVVNVPFERRGQRTDEYLEIMKSLWTEETSEYHGELYDLPPCRMYPKPVQRPHPPLVIGGESDAALRRVAAHGQGWFGFNRTPDEVPEGLERLEKALAAQRPHPRRRRRDDLARTSRVPTGRRSRSTQNSASTASSSCCSASTATSCCRPSIDAVETLSVGDWG